ncbi:MAG: phenylalanine--tRNA ligase subunit alpha [Flavobacteriaceae bacterium]|nr:MAG: phenylalanine--tRNA ligase subunit alpha [Flavobacteriaceae bacterium]
MIDSIEKYIQQIEAFASKDAKEIEEFRIQFLGKKGVFNQIMEGFKSVPPEQKKEFGQKANTLKNKAQEKIDQLKAQLDSNKESASQEDFTKSGIPLESGSMHPIALVRDKIIEIFSRIGFGLSDGPEIEDDWHNFTALNLPEFHPARDMQDTFFVEQNPDILLRTHTSSVQIRYMENHQPPFRILSPGRVFRNEDISARSHCMFHQIEGLYVAENVSFADLKQTLQYFTTELFGKSKIRLRPSYFPFTEPSAEIDVYWGLETPTDYKMTKGTGWLEIGGCGMIDPNVLSNVNIDPDVYSGFAFGVGVERIALLLYQIGDIRMYFENDQRFLAQFAKELNL